MVLSVQQKINVMEWLYEWGFFADGRDLQSGFAECHIQAVIGRTCQIGSCAFPARAVAAQFQSLLKEWDEISFDEWQNVMEEEYSYPSDE